MNKNVNNDSCNLRENRQNVIFYIFFKIYNLIIMVIIISYLHTNFIEKLLNTLGVP